MEEKEKEGERVQEHGVHACWCVCVCMKDRERERERERARERESKRESKRERSPLAFSSLPSGSGDSSSSVRWLSPSVSHRGLHTQMYADDFPVLKNLCHGFDLIPCHLFS